MVATHRMSTTLMDLLELIRVGSAKLEQDMICLSVSDNGLGIHPDYNSIIFGLFQCLYSQ